MRIPFKKRLPVCTLSALKFSLEVIGSVVGDLVHGQLSEGIESPKRLQKVKNKIT